MEHNHGVVVIGSMTADVTAIAEQLPRRGETVLGNGLTLVSGGKGANQAVMASNMNVPTWMVGCIGNDVFRSVVVDSLHLHGVKTDFVDILDGESTGVAHIRVDESANNDIVIVPMANYQTNPERVDRFFEANPAVNVLLLQLEIPVETVIYAAKKAKSLGIKVIFDPAPVVAFPEELYQFVDIVTPNETEASVLTGVNVTDVTSAEQAARVLYEKGVRTVIVTLAEKGLLVLDENGVRSYSPYHVQPVDTTAAGDAFTGALGACIAQGLDLSESLQFAMAAGALAVTKLGAQTSLPTRVEVEHLVDGGNNQ